MDNALKFISASSFETPQYITTSAWLEHAPFAFWLTEQLKPHTLVELGAHHGFSYFTFCQIVKKLRLPTRCYAIDTWHGDEHSGYYDESVFENVNSHNSNHYADFSKLIRMHFDVALDQFEDNSIDLLHIDGRHYYQDVLHDFNTWKSKLSKQSIVLFHDINVKDRDFGVYKLWEELKSQYRSFEFMHGYGLGVLATGTNYPILLQELFATSNNDMSTIQFYYGKLGNMVSLQTVDSQYTFTHQINQQDAKVLELLKDLHDKEHLIHSLNNQIACMLNSKSWRVISVLRNLKKKFA